MVWHCSWYRQTTVCVLPKKVFTQVWDLSSSAFFIKFFSVAWTISLCCFWHWHMCFMKFVSFTSVSFSLEPAQFLIYSWLQEKKVFIAIFRPKTKNDLNFTGRRSGTWSVISGAYHFQSTYVHGLLYYYRIIIQSKPLPIDWL